MKSKLAAMILLVAAGAHAQPADPTFTIRSLTPDAALKAAQPTVAEPVYWKM